MIAEVVAAGRAVRSAAERLEIEIGAVKMPKAIEQNVRQAHLLLQICLLHLREAHKLTAAYVCLADKAKAAAEKGGGDAAGV